mgnify:CR=1 FL=1
MLHSNDQTFIEMFKQLLNFFVVVVIVTNWPPLVSKWFSYLSFVIIGDLLFDFVVSSKSNKYNENVNIQHETYTKHEYKQKKNERMNYRRWIVNFDLFALPSTHSSSSYPHIHSFLYIEKNIWFSFYRREK